MERHWTETLAEGTEVPMAFLAVDLAGSTQATAADGEKFHRTVEPIILEFGGALLQWHGDGNMGFFYDPDGFPEVAAFRAARRILERLLTEHGLTSHLGLHSGRARYGKDLGRDVHADPLNKAGHLGKVAPPQAILVSAEAAEALPDDLREQLGYFGTTRRDRVECLSWPRKPGSKPDAAEFLPPGEDLFEVRTRYLDHLRRSTKYLRLVGARQIRKEAALDLLSIFVPPDLVHSEGAATPELSPEELAAAARAQPSDAPADEREGANPAREDAWAQLFFRPPPERLKLPEALERHRMLALVGDPGTGKTTILRWLAHVAASGRRLASHLAPALAGRLPILAPAAAVHALKGPGASLVEALALHWNAEGVAGTKPLFDAAVKDGTALILLDGLDELIEASSRVEMSRYLAEFAAVESGVRFVITSRKVGFEALLLGAWDTFEVQPFGREQVECLAGRWFVDYERSQTPDDPDAERRGADEAREFLSAIRENERLVDLLANPFLLTLACLVQRQGGALPRYRVELYDVIGQTLVETWDKVRSASHKPVGGGGRDYRREAREILQPLARHLHGNAPQGWMEEDDLTGFIAERLMGAGTPKPEARGAAKKLLRELRSATHLLVERGPARWGFMHPTFQEFFTAHDIVAAEQFTGLPVYDPRWREIIRLVAGILGVLQGRPKAVAALMRAILDADDPIWGRILRKNLWLAADCLHDAGGADAETHEWVLNELAQIALRGEFAALRRQAARALGALVEVMGQCAIRPLLEGSRDADADVRLAAVRALGQLAGVDPEVTDALLAAFEGHRGDPRLGTAAVAALGRRAVANPKVAGLLLSRSGDSHGSPWIRQAASLALSDWAAADPANAGSLVARVEDCKEDDRLRRAAARALGLRAVADPKVAAVLIARLVDQREGTLVRMGAAGALQRAVTSREVRDALLARANDPREDAWVRDAAAGALAGRAAMDPEIARALLARPVVPDLLWEDLPGLAEWAAADLEIAQILLARVEHREDLSIVRSHAARALAVRAVTDPKVAGALLATLEDLGEDAVVRAAAVRALAQRAATEPGVATKFLRLLERLAEHVLVRAALVEALDGLPGPPPVERASPPVH